MKTTKTNLKINILHYAFNCSIVLLFYCSVSYGQSKQAIIELAVSATDTSNWVTASVFEKTDEKKVPVNNVEVHFYVQRMFSLLPVKGSRKNYTDTSGTTSVEIFNKSELPGDAEGNVTILAKIEEDDNYGNAETKITAKIGKPVPLNAGGFPKALWAPHAPVALVMTFVFLLGSVWCTYIYVLSLTAQIKKAGNDEVTKT